MSFGSETAGVTAVEFAFVVPVFIIMVFGIVEFGQGLKVHNELDHAVSRAARLIMIDNDVAPATVETEVRTFLSALDQGGLSVNMTSNTVDGRDYRIVTLSYPYELSVPMASGININLSATIGVPLRL